LHTADGERTFVAVVSNWRGGFKFAWQYVRLEDPPGLSPITTVGHFDTVEATQVATDEV
jgi:hypothetical protein